MLPCWYAREDNAFDHSKIVTSSIMRLAKFFFYGDFLFLCSHVSQYKNLFNFDGLRRRISYKISVQASLAITIVIIAILFFLRD